MLRIPTFDILGSTSCFPVHIQICHLRAYYLCRHVFPQIVETFCGILYLVNDENRSFVAHLSYIPFNSEFLLYNSTQCLLKMPQNTRAKGVHEQNEETAATNVYTFGG